MSVVASESNRVLVFGVDDVEAPDEVDPLDEVQSSISDQSKSITSAKSEDLEDEAALSDAGSSCGNSFHHCFCVSLSCPQTFPCCRSPASSAWR